MKIKEENYLAHYGILRRSGRYPWGSGGNVPERSRSFLDHVAELRRQGLSDTEIARGMALYTPDGKPWTTTEFRNASSIAKNAKRQADVTMAQRLRDKGNSNMAISRRMGIPESSVRALLAPGVKDRLNVLHTTANMLKEQVDQKKYVDVGTAVEYHLGISREKLDTAIAILKDQGYTIHHITVPQLGTTNNTTHKILAGPGITRSEVSRNRAQIQQIRDYSEDGGRSFFGILPPISVNTSRVAVRYGDQGGKEADGVIYVRPGTKDLELGGNRYAQVRVMVNGTHYLKGMAVYKDDLPDGVDLMFNTNKSDTGNKLDAMKPLKDDPDNPFGSTIRQITEKLPNGKDRVTSAMNLVNEEGDWDTWSRNLSSQFLSKQTPKLAKTQLDMTYEARKNELNSILELTNPAVRRTLLDKFSENVDSAAVHLKAAKMPRQSTHVILPVKSLKENEVYAPNFRPGERVVLIRHPHAGTFEIPELVVNNRNPEGKKIIGTGLTDAIGIHPNVAKHLSGADFDGDTVLVIPNNGSSVKRTAPLQGLKEFDPQIYKLPEDSTIPRMNSRQTQAEMGKISNLITDMTIQAASTSDLARAVRHSMVVIDAEKHGLNYRQSAIDNGIKQLKEKYQGGSRHGAATLISRAGSEQRVPMRRPLPVAKGGAVNKKTGELQFEPTGESFVNRKGELVVKKFMSTKLAETKNAFDLVSKDGGTKIEEIYATHSNRLKDLANQARLASIHTKPIPYSPSAKAAYKNEVESLDSKLKIALRNRPLERQAQLLANVVVSAKRQANPDMDHAELKKVKAQALEEMRTRTGAGKKRIKITEEEWKAIQSGAISNHQLTEILRNSDLELVKQLATPKRALLMTTTKTVRAREMIASGYSPQDVADHLGVSLTTLKTALSGKG